MKFFYWLKEIVQLKRFGYHWETFTKRDRASKILEARDIVLTITLASMAEQFIGTFSSNMGRLIAMLRSSYPLETNWDLESDIWHAF